MYRYSTIDIMYLRVSNELWTTKMTSGELEALEDEDDCQEDCNCPGCLFVNTPDNDPLFMSDRMGVVLV